MFKGFLVLYGLAALARGAHADKMMVDPTHIHAVLISAVTDKDPKHFAVNYAPEAEIAQTYHWLIEHEVPPDNIILLMNTGFTDNPLNPEPGLYTDVARSRNYAKGLRIDYRGDEVTVDNYLAVLRGEKDKVTSGSGRVLHSTEEDHVFVSHEGHGFDGGLPIGKMMKILTIRDLKNALEYASKKKMFKSLTYFIMACKGGSMFSGQLNASGSIYAITAAKPGIDAFPEDMIETATSYIFLNTQFGKAWLEDIKNHNTVFRTLNQQYEDIVTRGTIESFPSQYGNLKISEESVASFLGINNITIQKQPHILMSLKPPKKNKDGERIPISSAAILLKLSRDLNKATNSTTRRELKKQIKDVEKEKLRAHGKIKAITSQFMDAISGLMLPVPGSQVHMPKAGISLEKSIHNQSAVAINLNKSPDKITQLDCHHTIMKTIDRECGEFKNNAFFPEFVTPLVNLCEYRFDTNVIVERIKEQCKD